MAFDSIDKNYTRELKFQNTTTTYSEMNAIKVLRFNRFLKAIIKVLRLHVFEHILATCKTAEQVGSKVHLRERNECSVSRMN